MMFILSAMGSAASFVRRSPSRESSFSTMRPVGDDMGPAAWLIASGSSK